MIVATLMSTNDEANDEVLTLGRFEHWQAAADLALQLAPAPWRMVYQIRLPEGRLVELVAEQVGQEEEDPPERIRYRLTSYLGGVLGNEYSNDPRMACLYANSTMTGIAMAFGGKVVRLTRYFTLNPDSPSLTLDLRQEEGPLPDRGTDAEIFPLYWSDLLPRTQQGLLQHFRLEEPPGAWKQELALTNVYHAQAKGESDGG